MQIRHKPPFPHGYTPLVPRAGATADMLMEFGVFVMAPGEEWEQEPAPGKNDEQCWLLASGNATLSWSVEGAGQRSTMEVSRPDLFDHSPWCLSIPKGTELRVTAGSQGAEFFYIATDNPRSFAPRLYSPEECRSEMRGAGAMRETSTRIVRTCFDDTTRPQSNLVIGEVIGVPGKWSSYPNHHHPQPEIYHYRLHPAGGFGLTVIGETPYLIKNNDTILIREGEVHPQVTAPGYALWYLWVIRHLDGAHYGPATNTPIFVDEHRWVMEKNAPIWEPRA